MKMNKLNLAAAIVLFFSTVASSQISGTVFRDYNANGVKDNVLPLDEPAIAGVTVKAYNSAGIEVGSTISGSNGSYSFTSLTLPLRIEFSGLQAGDYSSVAGGTSVQFYSFSTTSANYGINYPAEYAEKYPDVVVPSFIYGSISGTYKDSSAVRLAPYDQRILPFPPDGPAYTNLATHAQVGSLYGQAYNKQNGDRYFSAFLKRLVGFGPGSLGANGSPGAIYKINSQKYQYHPTTSCPLATKQDHLKNLL
jgi:hypothetical protein